MFRILTVSLIVAISLAGCQSTSPANNQSTTTTNSSNASSSSTKSAIDYNQWQHDWYHRNADTQ